MSCFDPAYENHEFVKTMQEIHDLRHARGLMKEKARISYVPFEEALRRADFCECAAAAAGLGERDAEPLSSVQRKDS